MRHEQLLRVEAGSSIARARMTAIGADFIEKSKNRAGRELAKWQSDGTSPLNNILDRLRTSHAAPSTNWLVPQLIF